MTKYNFSSANKYYINKNYQKCIQILEPSYDQLNLAAKKLLINAYQGMSDHQRAIDLIDKEVDERNEIPEEWISTKALSLSAMKRLVEVENLFKGGINKWPKNAEFKHNLAVLYANQGKWDEAKTLAEQANEIIGDNSAILTNLGRILIALKETGAAKNIFKKVMKLMPNLPEGYNGIGAALLLEFKVEQAIGYFKKALSIAKNHGATLGNLGVAYKTRGEYEKAKECFAVATKVEAENPEHHWNLALLKLLLGQYKEGWQEYEWRYNPTRTALDRVRLPDLETPMLKEGDSVAGKIVALIAEQGFGDIIQFGRYSQQLKDEGAKIVLLAPDPLIPVMQTIPWVDYVCNRWSVCPKLDYWVYPMSLPSRYKTDIETIPSILPYIFAKEGDVKNWSQILGPKTKLRVGLVWAGRPGHGNDKNRSMSLQDFDSILSLPNIEFISLQTGAKSEESVEGVELRKFGSHIKTFADTAAILSQVDLLITIDSAPAHLAGALGCPTWVLLPYNPDFRWMLKRNDSPWYGESMRLYRQEHENGWPAVISKLRNDLIQFSQNPVSRSVILVPDFHSAPEGLNESGAIAFLQVAIAQHQGGNIEIAENIYRFILRYCPKNIDALRNLASCLRGKGDIVGATSCYEIGLSVDPNDYFAHSNYANLLADTKQIDLASNHALKAIQLNPAMHNAWYILSVVSQHSGNLDDAIQNIDKALALDGLNVTYLTMKGLVLVRKHQLEEARHAFERAKTINPNHTELLIGFGQLCMEECNYEQSLKYFNDLLQSSLLSEKLRPEVLTSRSLTLNKMGRVGDAEESAKKCIELVPENADAHFNLAVYALTLGNFDLGWKEYEWRYHPDRQARDRTIPIPIPNAAQWKGELLQGKSIVVLPEQGNGDNIQFIRYAGQLKAQGAVVYLLTNSALKSVMQSIPGLDGVFSNVSELPSCDFWVLPLSLPYLFKTSLNSIPNQVPYIFPKMENNEAWKLKLDELGLLQKPLIILNTSGASSHGNDRNRSIPLEKFNQILQLDDKYNFALIDVQKYKQVDKVLCGSKELINLGSAIKDFSDTASIFSFCNRVISVDSAPLHLAGAMGVKALGLIPFSPDFRWLLERSDSPWYPGMKLLRQSRPGDWDAVLAELKASLDIQV